LPSGCDVVDADVRVFPERSAGHDDGHPHEIQAPPFVVADGQSDEDQGVDLSAGWKFIEEAPALPLFLDFVEEHIEVGAAQTGDDAVEHGCVEPMRHVGRHDRDPAAGSASQPSGVRRDRVRQVVSEVPDPPPGLLGYPGRATQRPGDRRS
jgi:hypothetical protein